MTHLQTPKLTVQTKALFNTLANIGGQAGIIIVGFLLVPFMLTQVGAESYGLWVLIGSLTGYGKLFDFGISQAVIKYVAEYQARSEAAYARRLVATALWIYLALAAVVLLVSVLVAPWVPVIFQIAPENRQLARDLLLLSGLGVAIAIPSSVSWAVLRGLQRFDLGNLIGVVGTLIAAAGTVVVLLLGGSLRGVALVNVVVPLLMQIPSLWMIYRIAPELRPIWRGAEWGLVRKVFTFSSSVFLVQVAGRLQNKTDEFVIGAFMPTAAITPYVVSRRLGEIAQLLTTQFIKVLLPIASALQTADESLRLRQIFFVGTRLTLAMSLPLGMMVMLLAGPLLTLWVGPEYAPYSSLVILLTIATLIDLLLWVPGTILQSMERHHRLAYIGIGTAICNVVLSISLISRFGLVGVALGTLIPTAVASLGLALPYTMRILQVRPLDLFRQIVLPAILPAVPMAAVLAVSMRLYQAESPLSMLLLSLLGMAIYAGGYLTIGIDAFERRTYLNWARQSLQFVQTHLRRP